MAAAADFLATNPCCTKDFLQLNQDRPRAVISNMYTLERVIVGRPSKAPGGQSHA